MSISHHIIEHIRFSAGKAYEKVTAAFEEQLGRFDADVYKQLQTGRDPAAVRATIESMVGPSGFMLFKTSDHGSLLRIKEKPRKAIQYLLGNPLFAIEMTQHAIGAASLRAAPRAHLRGPGWQDLLRVRSALVTLRTVQRRRRSTESQMLDQKLEALVASALR